ncbi:MAG: LamG-like jellyroll fold domain-containing protein [Verrucomicrobiota bacterium]
MPSASPATLPDLVAFWDFQDDTLQSHGPAPIRLRAEGAPLEYVPEGVFGPRALRFRAVGELAANHLVATAAEAPALNIGGPDARVTVVAWIKRESTGYGSCEFIAGVWNEHHRRQYGMFLNLSIWNSAQQLGAHISSHGGPTPGYPYCMDVAIGATPVPIGAWQCVAITYDGECARAYLDGKLDVREPQGDYGRNPFRYPGGLLAGDADFTVGAVARPAKVVSDGQGGFIETGGLIANPFVGLLGGLAVYKRALSDDEIAALANAGR